MFQHLLIIKINMNKKYLHIDQGTLEEAYKIAKSIDAFDQLYPFAEFENRTKGVIHLILVAYYKNKPIAFKIGYETLPKKIFYSWMGGVLKKYRKSGIAQQLIDAQEKWLKKNNYERIMVKTRNKHVGMINLLRNNNYIEMAKIPYEPDEETRLLFEKELN